MSYGDGLGMELPSLEVLETYSQRELLVLIARQNLIIQNLNQDNQSLQERIGALEERILDLQERVAFLRKDSQTSSKPPSSDIVKPPRDKPPGDRHRGGQKGHPGFFRRLFLSEKVDEVQEYRLVECPHCHTSLSEEDETDPWIQQVAELPEKLIHITEHRRKGYRCPACARQVYAPLPQAIQEGQLFGIRLLSLVGSMKASLHASYTGLQEFLKEALELEVSRSHLCNSIARLSEVVAPVHTELGLSLACESTLHVDETGFKDSGRPYWIWVFCTEAIAFFSVQKSRGAQVLKDILGEVFKGSLVSDFLSAYRKYASAFQQFCLAHLIRDIKFLTQLPGRGNQAFGEKLLDAFKELFRLWHQREKTPEVSYRVKLTSIQQRLRSLVSQKGLPERSQTLAKRLEKHWSSYLRFLVDPSIPPTNNLAEQTIRTVVIDRKITQGTRSEMGRKWASRIWSVIATCRKQKRSSWKFLQDCLRASYFGAPYPSLIPAHCHPPLNPP